ncbi:MAG: AMP-binding protein, partial [Actinomycetota bacterium]|nr:AMP-binding protein [Actinomycetota bacterium]
MFLKDKKFSEISSEKFVAILSKNLPAVFKIALSLINNGFTIIPLNPLLTGKQISRHLSAVNCNKIISDENLPSDFKHDCQVFNTRDIHLISRSYRKLCEIRNIFNDISSRCNRKTSIVFTSGSTGMPKAVLHTLGNH